MSAIYGPGVLDKTYKVGDVNTTTSQFRAVYFSAANTVSIVNTSTTKAIGTVQNYASNGSLSVDVRLLGISKAYCAASVTAGNYLIANSSGQVSGVAGDTTVAFAQAAESGSTNSAISVIIK